jgi:hypothetical protein
MLGDPIGAKDWVAQRGCRRAARRSAAYHRGGEVGKSAA